MQRNCSVKALLLLLTTIIPVSTAQGFDWQLTQRLDLSAIYSDNIELSESDPENELVGAVSPSLSLSGEGNRSSALFLAGFNYLNFARSSSDLFNPLLFAGAETNPIQNLLFVEGNISANQVSGEAASPADDAVNAGDDSTTAYNLEFHPYLIYSFRDTADFTASVRHSRVEVFDDDLDASRRNELRLSLEHSPDVDGYLWGVSGSIERTDLAEDNFIELRRVDAEAGFTYRQVWLFSGSVGHEWVNEPDRTDENSESVFDGDESAIIWDVGLSWRPSERTEFSAGYGERLFGGRPRLQFDHSTRRSNVTLSWSRGVTRSRAQIQRSPATDLITDVLSTSPDVDSDSSILDSQGLGVLENQFAIDEQVQLSFRLDGRRTSFLGDVLRTETESNDVSTDSITWQLQTALERRLSSRWLIRADYEYSTTELTESSNTIQENRVGLTLTYERVR